MKKIVVLFFAVIIGSAAITVNAADSAPAQAENMSAQIEKLRAELKELSVKYEKQVKDDMAILAKLRQEIRELKVENRKLKLEAKSKQALSANSSEKSVANEKPVAQPKAEESEPVRKQKAAANKVEQKYEEDSSWNHMFPF